MSRTPENNADIAYDRGTTRTRHPAETFADVAPYFCDFGITRVANITGLDRIGIPVVTACRPNSRSLAVSQGKGLDLAAAKASAVMESIELFHAERVHVPLLFGSEVELDRHYPLLATERLPRASRAVFDSQCRILWAEGRRWCSSEPLWVPHELVSADYTLPTPQGSGYFAATTNGLASGNTREEAVLHGLCEVVERDAVALWKLRSRRQQHATTVDLERMDDVHCQSLLQRFHEAGVTVRVWDVTSNVGVATYLCLAMGPTDDWADPEFGAGTHPSRAIALCRALTEAAQARATYIAGARDDIGAELYSVQAKAQRYQYCRGLMRGEPMVTVANTPDYSATNVGAALAHTEECLRRQGLDEIAVVDLSRPPYPVAVVRVMVPGLEGAAGHEQAEYVPGPRALAVQRGAR